MAGQFMSRFHQSVASSLSCDMTWYVLQAVVYWGIGSCALLSTLHLASLELQPGSCHRESVLIGRGGGGFAHLHMVL